jgi:DNA-binding response OmpR family regulator
MRVQLIEDHARLAQLVQKGLRQASFDVEIFSRGDDALAALECTHYDAVVLDLGLPDRDGLGVLKTLRGRGVSTPVLILTSRIRISDRVAGLDAGADDYLTKPFAMEELVARLHALLRRPQTTLGSTLGAGNLVLEPATGEVFVAGTRVPLSHREIGALQQLMRREGRAVPKKLLEDTLYGLEEAVTPNTVEVLIHRLRKKLSEAGATVDIQTARGIGYVLRHQA